MRIVLFLFFSLVLIFFFLHFFNLIVTEEMHDVELIAVGGTYHLFFYFFRDLHFFVHNRARVDSVSATLSSIGL